MIEHHIQKTIVYSLAHTDGMRFAELKPDGIENKLFDYHLKIVIRDGFASKSENGVYSLTPEGRRIWLRTSKNQNWFAEVAYSVLFLVVRRKSDEAWLLAKRKTHPLYGLTGFIQGAPDAAEPVAETGAKLIKQKTGLQGSFEYLGSGYLRMYEKKNLESFTHFDLLVCEDASGELEKIDEHADYEWLTEPNFSAATMIPNMTILTELYLSGEQFFVEETIQL